MKNKKKHLYYLNELSDYKVASNYSDVTGWSVKDKDNRVIGKVDNLLVNKDLERVVYLDVEVDETIIEANHDPYGRPANTEVHEFVNKEGENHVIIPVGLVDINNDQKFIYTNTIDYQTFAETKRIRTGANINREYEEAVMGSYKRKRDVETSREDKAEIKESPYKADREKEQRHMEQDSNRELTREELEREKADLKQKRKELEEERVKLEQERLLLEEERQRQDPEFWSNKKREALTGSETSHTPKNVESHKERPNHRGISESDDSFYDREEFDGQNYRGKG